MFHRALSDITFKNIDAFCQAWPEGVRVEYKVDWPNIPKVVSSFANTMGGILIIGVDADRTTGMPILPIHGITTGPGLEERVTQSCYQGIYPPITPSIRVISIPSTTDRVVVVVKVAESIEAPHAIENTTRVYIRVNSTTEPIELAEIDRIEYLLNRRQNPKNRREEMISEAFGRFSAGVPRLCIAVVPSYPNRPLFTPDSLSEGINDLNRDPKVSSLGNAIRRSQEGYISARPPTSDYSSYHLAVSFFGLICFDRNLEVLPATGKHKPYINLVQVVLGIAWLFRAAQILLDRAETTNLVIRAGLQNAAGHAIHSGASLIDPDLWLEHYWAPITDYKIEAETFALSETLREKSSDYIIELVRQLMWAFNWADDAVSARTLEILRANNLP